MLFKKVFIPLALIIVLPLIALAEEEKPFSILLSIPLSGNASYYGEEARKAAEFALADINDDRIQVIIEDDQLNTVKAISNYKNHPEADAVISFSSGTANGIAPIAETEQKVHLAIASDKKVIEGRKFSFLHWMTPEEEVKVLREELVRRNYQRLALVNTEHEGSNAVFDVLHQDFTKNHLDQKVILEETFLPGEMDFKSFIIKAKQKQADAIIILLFPGPLANFAKQSRQLKWEGDLVGIELFEDENEVKAAQGALLNQWYVNSELPVSDFAQRYQEKYHTYPSAYVPNIYDSIRLLSLAAKLHNGDRPKIANYLATLKDYHGACGTYSALGDNRFDLKATVKVVTKDGFKKLE